MWLDRRDFCAALADSSCTPLPFPYFENPEWSVSIHNFRLILFEFERDLVAVQTFAVAREASQVSVEVVDLDFVVLVNTRPTFSTKIRF